MLHLGRIACGAAIALFVLAPAQLRGADRCEWTGVDRVVAIGDVHGAYDRFVEILQTAGIVDGSVDVIATDHAPHHIDEKLVEFDRAPFGIVGLETAVPIVFDRLVHAGRISLTRMVELLSVNPARLMNLPGGSLAEGAPADVTILAPDLPTTIDAARLVSRSKNTPFDRWHLTGAVVATMVGGRVVYRNAAAF